MTKIKGIKRTTESVEMEVDSFTLMEAAKEGLTANHLVELVRSRITNLIKNKSPELEDKFCIVHNNRGNKVWVTQDGWDHHKDEALWRIVREVSSEEEELFKFADDLEKIITTFGDKL